MVVCLEFDSPSSYLISVRGKELQQSSTEKEKLHKFGKTWGWVNDNWILIWGEL